jgi:hypothetical protein
MTISQWLAVAALVVSTSACGRPEVAPFGGGEKESQLIAATVAVDVVKVREALAAGADPNKLVSFRDNLQSGWLLALDQLKPGRVDMVEIVRAMLKSGAKVERAWGTGIRQVNEQLTFRQQLAKPRQKGSSDEDTMWLAVTHGSREAVRALLDAGYPARGSSMALAEAVNQDDTEMVKMLLDAGAEVNPRSGTSQPPLLVAIQNRDVAMMTLLEEHGALEKPQSRSWIPGH